VSASSSRRRIRRRWLITAVVLVDLLGLAALAFALTHHSNPAPKTAQSAADAAAPVAHPHTPQTLIGDPAEAPSAPATRRQHRRPSPKPSLRARASAPPRFLASPAAQASFERLAAGMPGAVGLAIAPLGDGPLLTFGSLQIGHAWSTMKVPVLATLLGRLEAHGGALDSAQRADATAALEASDNAAAEALFSSLEQSDGGLLGASLAVQQTLRRAGDESTTINTTPNSGGFTTWGQSEWSASGEVSFYRSLARGCLLSASDSSYVLSLMGQVESDQRWGAGSAGYSQGVTLAFKGGWGPENGAGYLVRQSAIVGSGDHGYVLSMLAKPSDGSFSSGTQMLTELASWAARAFPSSAASAPAGACS
jgi:hypothetical protein